MNTKSRSLRPSGDLIPWTISQQFQDDDFPSLSGARIVRIATHPQLQGMGYGSRALQQLIAYYEGKLTSPDKIEEPNRDQALVRQIDGDLNSILGPRRGVPPLLVKLNERAPEHLHYLGTSFGMTPNLFSFWKKSNFLPVYLRLTELAVTGEHTCIMLRSLQPLYTQAQVYNQEWLNDFYDDFTIRFAQLLGFSFRKFPVQTALSLMTKQREKTDLLDGAPKEYYGRRGTRGKRKH